MIEIILILFGCIAISMFIIFGVEMCSMVQEFIKLNRDSKINHVKKTIPILIIVAILLSIMAMYVFKTMQEHAPY